MMGDSSSDVPSSTSRQQPFASKRPQWGAFGVGPDDELYLRDLTSHVSAVKKVRGPLFCLSRQGRPYSGTLSHDFTCGVTAPSMEGLAHDWEISHVFTCLQVDLRPSPVWAHSVEQHVSEAFR